MTRVDHLAKELDTGLESVDKSYFKGFKKIEERVKNIGINLDNFEDFKDKESSKLEERESRLVT